MDRVTALVLAAGAGSRLASAAGGRPKPLVEIAGAPVLAHNLRWLAQAGVRRVWINLHHRPDAVRKTIGDGSACGLSVSYLFEPALLGTSGAALNLPEQWHDPLLVVYGDNLVRFSLDAFRAFHRSHGDPVSIALFDPGTHPHTGMAGGRVTLGAGARIESFTEGGAARGGPLVNTGVYLLAPSVRTAIPGDAPSDFARDVFPALLARGVPMRGHVIDGFCLGLDTPAAYSRARAMVDRGEVRVA